MRMAVCLFLLIVGALDCVWADTAETPVDLELVLAVDFSASMSDGERQLQRQGYVAAFRSPKVLAAIRSGGHGRIAVAYVAWADAGEQTVVVPWTIVDSAQSAAVFAATLAAVPTETTLGTSISAALLFSTGLFHRNGFAGERRAIDISGNGPNNSGPAVDAARDLVVADGITINGLPILIHNRWGGGLYDLSQLDRYFDDCVIGGPGAFTVAVHHADEFEAAIERKLILEVSWRPSHWIPVVETRPLRSIDCRSGEKVNGRLLPAD